MGPAVGARAGPRPDDAAAEQLAGVGQDARLGGRRSPSCCGRICPGCCRPTAATTAPAEPTAGFGRRRCSTPCAGAVHCSTPTSRPSPVASPAEVEEGLWDGVARGLLTADGLSADPLASQRPHPLRPPPADQPSPPGLARAAWAHAARASRAAGRCCPPPSRSTRSRSSPKPSPGSSCIRWGVVFRDVYLKERLAVPWREILWALRRLEARGLIRGGHFVTGDDRRAVRRRGDRALLRARHTGAASSGRRLVRPSATAAGSSSPVPRNDHIASAGRDT